MKIRPPFLPIAIAVLLAAVGGPATASDEPDTSGVIAVDLVEGITWELQQQAVDGELVSLPDGVVVTLLMEDGQAGGTGGCNSYFAAYTLEGDAVSFMDIGSTMMACPGDPSEVEATYFENLAAVEMGVSTGGTLVMSDGDGNEILLFAAAEDEGEGEVMPVEGIEGITWLLERQAVDGEPVDIPGNVLVSLLLEDGGAGGGSGCNNYFASYTLEGSSLAFDGIGSTMMACLPALMEVEQAYLANLARVASFESIGAGISLLDAEGNVILEFSPAPEGSVIGSWVATAINNGREAVVSSDITAQVTAEFSADGELTGFDGCNRYFTTYEVDGDGIVISDAIGSTMMACPSEELAEQAGWYHQALVRATTWSVGPAGALELRDAEDALQVSYVPAE